MKQVVAILFLLSLCPSLTAQWQATEGPRGDWVEGIALHNDHVYIKTLEAGLLRSRMDSISWEASGTGLADDLRIVHVSLGNTLYVAADQGIYQTDDDGNSWQKLSSSPLDTLFIYSFLNQNGRIYAGTKQGLYYSDDSLQTWTSSTLGLPDDYIVFIAELDTVVYVGTGSEGVFKSTDNLTTWTAMNQGLEHSLLHVRGMAVVDSFLFMATQDALYRATNQSTSWDSTMNGIPFHPFWVSESRFSLVQREGSTVYTYFSNKEGSGLYFSTDLGTTWSKTDDNRPMPSVASSLLVQGDTFDLGFRSFVGLFRSIDAGATWEAKVEDQSKVITRSISSIDSSLFANTQGGLLMYSGDGGATWEDRNTGLRGMSFWDLQSFNDQIFLINSKGIDSSPDLGQTWTPFVTGPISDFAIQDSFFVLASLQEQAVYRSWDAGNTWDSSSVNFGEMRGLSIAISDSNIFIGTAHGDSPGARSKLYYSGDFGASWTERSGWLDSLSLFEPRLARLYTIEGELFVSIHPQGIYRSSDLGLTWTDVNIGTDPVSISRLVTDLEYIDGKLYAATSGNGLHVSLDMGDTWGSVEEGLENRFIYSLTTVDDTMYLSSIGVWKRAISEMLTNNETEHLPLSIELSPNPAEDLIHLEIPLESGRALQITIVNLLGQVLYSNNQPDSSQTIDISHWSPGVYIVICGTTQGLVSEEFMKR